MTTFSVIICTHNRADGVVGAIDSVLRQTFTDFEVIVVDDGSTDDTKARVSAVADPRVRYVYRENGGLSATRNTGVAASCGCYVTFLDDDDRVLPVWLERFHEVLRDGASVVSCGARWLDEDGLQFDQRVPGELGPVFSGYRGFFQAGTFALTREAYDAIGGFAEELRGSHQTEFALRLLPLCRERGWGVGTVDATTIMIVVQKAEGRARNSPQRLLAATCYIIDHHHDQLAHSPEMLADYYATAGVAAARTRAFPDARRLLWEAARTSQVESRRWKHRVRWLVAWVPPVSASCVARRRSAAHQASSRTRRLRPVHAVRRELRRVGSG